MTAEQYGPVNALAVWDAADEHPIYLVTTHTDLDHAVALYRRRAQIETYFSDQKSRGFRINRSHLSDPVRLTRLLIATTLACLWVVYLGVVARRDAVSGRIHRSNRCDLSLFSLGLRLLVSCLRHQRTIPRGLPKPLVRARQHALKSSVR
ncbi:MAG: transposase [Chloroflexi bacterium]|nr:transposase [Chloroflexota bacterium]